VARAVVDGAVSLARLWLELLDARDRASGASGSRRSPTRSRDGGLQETSMVPPAPVSGSGGAFRSPNRDQRSAVLPTDG
jgi:hypothetical protein